MTVLLSFYSLLFEMKPKVYFSYFLCLRRYVFVKFMSVKFIFSGFRYVPALIKSSFPFLFLFVTCVESYLFSSYQLQRKHYRHHFHIPQKFPIGSQTLFFFNIKSDISSFSSLPFYVIPIRLVGEFRIRCTHIYIKQTLSIPTLWEFEMNE